MAKKPEKVIDTGTTKIKAKKPDIDTGITVISAKKPPSTEVFTLEPELIHVDPKKTQGLGSFNEGIKTPEFASLTDFWAARKKLSEIKRNSSTKRFEKSMVIKQALRDIKSETSGVKKAMLRVKVERLERDLDDFAVEHDELIEISRKDRDTAKKKAVLHNKIGLRKKDIKAFEKKLKDPKFESETRARFKKGSELAAADPALKELLEPRSSSVGVRARQRRRTEKPPEKRNQDFLKGMTAFIDASKDISDEALAKLIGIDAKATNPVFRGQALIREAEDAIDRDTLNDIAFVEKIAELKAFHNVPLTPIEKVRVSQVKRFKESRGLTNIPDVLGPDVIGSGDPSTLAQGKIRIESGPEEGDVTTIDVGRGPELRPDEIKPNLTPGGRLAGGQHVQVASGSLGPFKKPLGVIQGLASGIGNLFDPDDPSVSQARAGIAKDREARLAKDPLDRLNEEILQLAAGPSELLVGLIFPDPFDSADPETQGKGFGEGLVSGIAASILEAFNNPLDTAKSAPLTTVLSLAPIVSAAKAAAVAGSVSKPIQLLAKLHDSTIKPALKQLQDKLGLSRITSGLQHKTRIKKLTDDVLLKPEIKRGELESIAGRLAAQLEGPGKEGVLADLKAALSDIDADVEIQKLRQQHMPETGLPADKIGAGDIDPQLLGADLADSIIKGRVLDYQIPELIQRHAGALKQAHMKQVWKNNRKALEGIAAGMVEKNSLFGARTLSVESRNFLGVPDGAPPVLVPTYFDRAVKYRSLSQDKMASSVMQLQQMAKRNSTANNLESGLNNMLSNAFMQMVRRGQPVPATVAKGLKLLTNYKRWRRGEITDPTLKSFYREMEKNGLLDATALIDAELGTAANLVKDIPGIGPLVDFINTKTPLGGLYGKLQDFYRLGDNIFKLEEAWHVRNKGIAHMKLLQPGEHMIFDLGKGKRSTVSKTADGSWEINGIDSDWKGVTEIAGKHGVTSAQNLFFDYRDVGWYNDWLRSTPLLGLASPFTTWQFKAMDIPGFKKGLLSRMVEMPGFVSTNSRAVLIRQSVDAVGLSTRRALMVSSFRNGAIEHKEEYQKWLSFAPDEARSMMIRATSNPMWLQTKSTEAYNWMQPANAVVRAIDGIISGVQAPSQQEIKDLLSWWEKTDQGIAPEARMVAMRKLILKKSKKGFSIGDALDMLGLGGGMLSGVLNELNLTDIRAVKPEKLYAKLASMFVGGTTADLIRIGASFADPESDLHLISGITDTISAPTGPKDVDKIRETMIAWSFRQLTGLGFKPEFVGIGLSKKALKEKGFPNPILEKNIQRYSKKFKTALISPITNPKNGQIMRVRRDLNLSDEEKVRRIIKLKETADFYRRTIDKEVSRIKDFFKQQVNLNAK